MSKKSSSEDKPKEWWQDGAIYEWYKGKLKALKSEARERFDKKHGKSKKSKKSSD